MKRSTISIFLSLFIIIITGKRYSQYFSTKTLIRSDNTVIGEGNILSTSLYYWR
jgi:hypothetical protein